MKVLTLFSILGFASAACPNNCAGHGTCGEATQCDCYRNWFGADCSKRICTYSAAFVDTPVGDLNGDGEHGPARYFDPRLNTKVRGIDFVGGGQSEMYSHNYGYARGSRTDEHDEAHFYRECANKGTCDRTTGICNCFPGYEGEGCSRTSCPSNCNGHGRCRTIADEYPTYSAWDLHHTQMCACDPGYSGPSCAQRDCPKGADPVLYALEVTNSVQGIFWRSFNGAGAAVDKEQTYAARMPSTVHYTITFTDEYGDEHVTSLLSVEYKSHCETGAGLAACQTYPDYTTQTLMEHAESVNQSLGALPRGAIENKYVWTVGTEYDATGKAVKMGDLKDGAGADQKWMTYPKDWIAVKKTGKPSTPVDQLEYRLDTKIIPAGCQGKDIVGKDAVTQYGLCVFIQIENPGVQKALKVQYFYNPRTTSKTASPLVTHVVSGQTAGFNTPRINDAKNKKDPADPLYLVTVQDLQTDRVWNANDGDVSKLFISEDVTKLDACSKRGLCDFDTGMCDCFSGYSGIRCDDQNAIAYSY
jgi:hypothetical protein